jgi:NTE family protein
MLQALAEHGVCADIVVGTSVGSLNGAAVALDPRSAAFRLSHLWAGMTREQVFPGHLAAQARTLQRGKTHLFPNTGLAAVIDDFLPGVVSFDDLAVPFAAVCTDVGSGEAYAISSGRLLPALLASAAVPGLFPPIQHSGRLLYDGGLVANVPMRQAAALGARSVAVLDCAFPGRLPTPPRSLTEAVAYTALLMMRTQAVLDAPAIAADMPVVYLRGPEIRATSPLDFSTTDTLVKDAYAATREFLATLDVRAPGLYGSPGAVQEALVPSKS